VFGVVTRVASHMNLAPYFYFLKQIELDLIVFFFFYHMAKKTIFEKTMLLKFRKPMHLFTGMAG
jgi:hypothetical protein